MKVPANYKPADTGNGSTLLTGAQPYKNLNQSIKEQQAKR